MFSHLHRSGVCAAHNDSIRRFSGYISGDIIWEATCGDNIKSQAAYRTGVFWMFFPCFFSFQLRELAKTLFLALVTYSYTQSFLIRYCLFIRTRRGRYTRHGGFAVCITRYPNSRTRPGMRFVLCERWHGLT